MCVCKALFLLWMFLRLSSSGSAYNYEDYSEFSYNDVPDGDQREPGASNCPCDGGERLRWEKIFIMMEDSHVRQSILLQTNEELKTEISSLKSLIQKISDDISTSCLRVVEETCRSMNGQQNLQAEQNTTRLKRDVWRKEEMEEERRRARMKEKENVDEMIEMDKTRKMEGSEKWWRWTKWRFWR